MEITFYNTGGPGYLTEYEIGNTLSDDERYVEDLEPSEWVFLGHKKEGTIEIDALWYPEDSDRFPPQRDDPCDGTTGSANVRITTTTYGPDAEIDGPTGDHPTRFHTHDQLELALGGEKITEGENITCAESTIESSFEQ